MVCRFRDQGTSLQRVRRVLDVLRDEWPDIAHPLARRSFFTDGASVWVQLHGTTEEIVGHNKGHAVFADAIRTFAHEIRFVDDIATAWDVSEWVEIDPAVCFGAPVVRGTRIPARTIAANLAVASTEEVADWYGLSVSQVNGVAAYAA